MKGVCCLCFFFGGMQQKIDLSVHSRLQYNLIQVNQSVRIDSILAIVSQPDNTITRDVRENIGLHHRIGVTDYKALSKRYCFQVLIAKSLLIAGKCQYINRVVQAVKRDRARYATVGVICHYPVTYIMNSHIQLFRVSQQLLKIQGIGRFIQTCRLWEEQHKLAISSNRPAMSSSLRSQ